MNANELADALEAIGTTEVVMCDAATMLRQQQAEIEALKAELEKSAEVNRQLAEDIGYENEHYCLVWEDAYGKLKVVDVCPPPEGSIKLYTHPVKELTISNNEIHKEFLKLIENCDSKLSIGDVGFPALIEDFARAILRKAQEK